MKLAYFPALRTKSGEANALANLPSKSKDRICPILQIPEKIPKKFNTEFIKAWSGRYAILDGSYNTALSNNPHTFLNEFNHLISNKINIYPCYVLGSDPVYESAVDSIPKTLYALVGIKTNLINISTVINFVKLKNLDPANVILIIDLEDISSVYNASFSSFIDHSIENISKDTKWRCVVLLSASAPKDHSSLKTGRNTVLRLDWVLWNSVIKKNPSIHYGDYLTISPDLTSPPGFAITRATVSVRYTCYNEWVIYKGVQTSGPHGMNMTRQYIQHANSLVGEPAFGCLISSWADAGIMNTASLPPSSLGGAGGRERWVTYALNRHMAVVTAQLP